MKFVVGTINLTRGLFLDAYVFMRLWGWFVVPLGAVPLSYAHAMGLDLMFGLTVTLATPLKAEVVAAKAIDDNDEIALALAKILGVGIALALGAIIHGFMS